MTNREITAVAAKIFAAILIVTLLQQSVAFSAILIHLQQKAMKPAFITALVIGLTILSGLAIYLWHFANKMTKTAPKTVELPLGAENLEATLLRVLGLYFLISHAGKLLQGIATLLSYPKEMSISFNQYFAVGSYLVILTLGLTLIAKPQQWARFLGKFRGM